MSARPMGTNRLRGSLPRIGIRPAIDGRYGGVRESLEGQVMAMARTTAAFLSENVRHACGLPVECVIADTCIGGGSMGIAGSIVDQDFFQHYLGMRNETVDMTEFLRRMEESIYDQDEYARALHWTRENCPEGADVNPPEKQLSRAQKDAGWEF